MKLNKLKTECLTGKAGEVWEEELAALAQKTQLRYLTCFVKLIEIWGVIPDELFDMRFKDLKSDDPRDFKNMERRINKLMKEMEDEGSSFESARMVKKTMSSFFSAQGLDLRFKRKNGKTGESNGQKMITREQFRELYESLNVLNKKRNRAIFMMLKDSGLRVSDVAVMTVGVYRYAEDIKSELGESFKVLDPTKTQKCGVYAYVHLGPEAIETIDEYLLEREEKGEILGEDSILFLSRRKKQFTGEALSKVIQKKCVKLGLRRISAHSIRKRHKTYLEKFMPEQWVLMLQGKASSEYSRPQDEGELTTAYMRAYPAIRLYGDTRIDKGELVALRTEAEKSTEQVPGMMKVIAEQGKQIAELAASLAQLKAEKESERTR